MWSASRKGSPPRRTPSAPSTATARRSAPRPRRFRPQGSRLRREARRPGPSALTRPNGDTLLYDPKGNVFAVATKAGAPRTMFKPDDGPAYWEEQKASMARRQASRSDGARAE